MSTQPENVFLEMSRFDAAGVDPEIDEALSRYLQGAQLSRPVKVSDRVWFEGLRRVERSIAEQLGTGEVRGGDTTAAAGMSRDIDDDIWDRIRVVLRGAAPNGPTYEVWCRVLRSATVEDPALRQRMLTEALRMQRTDAEKLARVDPDRRLAPRRPQRSSSV